LDTDDEMKNVSMNDMNSEFGSSESEEEELRKGT